MTVPRSTRWARLVHRLRTEGDTPAQQACAVALGLFIGCTPLYGLHLTLALVLGTLFGLNRLKVYVAANISNPFVAPFLFALEVQVGALLRRGTWYSPATWSTIRVWDVAGDILLGCIVVGGVLAATMGALTYAVVNRRGLSREVASLLEHAAARYVDEGVAAWEFAHGKLRGDPVYFEVLSSGVLPRTGTIVDLGCGQGLMLALIVSARERHRGHEWPRDWPAPPIDATLIGVELRPKVAAMASRALAGEATILEQDITVTPLPACEAVLVFDVLHLLPRARQDEVLRAVAAALVPGGVLVLREANAAGGWRFTAVRMGNRLTALVQGKWRRTFHFRTLEQWRAALESVGLGVDAEKHAAGTAFANVTLTARKTENEERRT